MAAAQALRESEAAFATLANRGTHFIDGKFVAPARGGTFPILNPANNRVVGRAAAGTAEDVAGCALFLASDLSSYCTGTEVDVNGGSLIH